jgi:flagellar biosynthetic protein FlhB
LIWALFAALDYGWQWWMFEQQLRMTDTELRDELKESQGNPQIRARRRELYQDRA